MAASSHVKDILCFPGTIDKYRQFIPSFADISKTLSNLLTKDTPYTWTEECQESFKNIKFLLKEAPVLSYLDFSKPNLL